MKLGIIRCAQTEEVCPGAKDFLALRDKTGVFAKVESPIELVGFTTCGGCPGKKAVFRAKNLVAAGADTIAFASCITKGTPIGYPCPFAKRMIAAVEGTVEEGIEILDYTHGW